MNRLAAFLGRALLRNFLIVAVAVIGLWLGMSSVQAAPFAAYVMDARTGQTLYADNADTRLHPASLTKMMTLYITFEEIQRGRLSLDTMVTVTQHAASQPPSRLGLRAGQKIQLRYLIRAAAVKSANDAAAAIGDLIGGDADHFGVRMTKTARALGMKNTTFKNANGLTQAGHLSTARDMSILGRHLFYDFPQYYNIFSRRSTDAGMKQVASTNRRFLDSYRGADGIKTGYTEPAGFNLTASAERDGVRIIATVLGGKSTANRNAKMTELLDMGFAKAPRNATTQAPAAPSYQNADVEAAIASADLPDEEDGAAPEAGATAKTLRVVMAVQTSPRPLPRPDAHQDTAVAVSAMQDGIMGALAEATGTEPAAAEAPAIDVAAADTGTAPETSILPLNPNSLDAQAVQLADGGTIDAGSVTELAANTATAEAPQQLTVTAAAARVNPVELVAAPRAPKRKAPIYDDVVVAKADTTEVATPTPTDTEVITRISTSGGRDWGVNVGRFNSHGQAERALLKIQLAESATLGNGLRKVVQRSGGFDANVMGLGQKEAEIACARLQARSVQCFSMGP